LIDYADGRMSEAREEAVRAHVESCRQCSRAVTMLNLSRSALSTLDTVKMPAASADAVLANMRSEVERAASASRASISPGLRRFLSSPRALAAAGTATALIITVIVVVISVGGGKQPSTGLSTRGAPSKLAFEETKGAALQDQQKCAKSPTPVPAPMILPMVKVTETNYDQKSLHDVFDGMELRKQIAERYTMGDAINQCSLFKRKLADMLVDAGEDGATLEAMISYLTASEPVLLPYYAEKARFLGQQVFIIGLAGPRRITGTKKLVRTEVWVMNPEKFAVSPDSSIIYFLEQKSS